MTIGLQDISSNEEVERDFTLLRSELEELKKKYNQVVSDWNNLTLFNAELLKNNDLENIIEKIKVFLFDNLPIIHVNYYNLNADENKLILSKNEVKKEYIHALENILPFKIPNTIKISLNTENWYSDIFSTKKYKVAENERDIEQMILAFVESNYPNVPLKKHLSKTISIFKKTSYIITIPLSTNDKIFGIMDINFKEKPSETDIQRLNAFLSPITIIIKRKEDIEKIIQNEDKFRLITEKMSDVVWLMDLNGKSLFVSNSVTLFTGYSVEEYLTQTIDERFTPESAKIAKKQLNEEVTRFSNLEEVPNNFFKRIELDYICKDGNIKTGELIITPYFNENNICIGIHGVTRDMTKKNKNLELLKLSEQKYKNLFDNIQDVIYNINTEGIITSINHYVENVSGYKVDELIGMPVANLYWDPKQRDNFLEKLVKEKVINNYELVLRSKYNKPIYTIASSRVVFKEVGQPEYIEGVIHDITELKHATLKASGLSEIIENSLNEIYIFDKETLTFYFANNEALKNTKYTIDEIKYLTPVDLKPEFSVITFKEKLQPLLNNKITKLEFETYHKRKDGSIYPVEVHIQLCNYEGKPALNAIIFDISELKQSIQKIQESEEKFKAIANFAASWEAWFDYDGKLLWMNSYCEHMTGYTVNEYLKSNDYLKMAIAEEDIEKTINQFKEALKGSSGDNFEVRANCKDGSKKWLSINWRPLIDKDGKSIGFRTSARDISDRKLAEETLAAQNLYLQELNELSFGLATLSTDSNILSYIAEKLKALPYVQFVSLQEFDYKEKVLIVREFIIDRFIIESIFNVLGKKIKGMKFEVSDKMFDEIIKNKATIKKSLYDITLGNMPVAVAKTLETIIGVNKFLGISLTLDGVLYGTAIIGIKKGSPHISEEWMISLSNIISAALQRQKYQLELIAAKEKAEESDRLKSSFLANISHEIRTPMNGILGFAELLKSQELSGNQQKEYIEIIEKSGERMLNIINDVIEISKIESGIMKVNLSEFNVNEQIEFIYNFFKPEADCKNIKLEYHLDIELENAIIYSDKTKFNAILTNLIKNALKFTKEGSIIFGYKKHGHYLKFYIKDTGIGIPKERQTAIFDRFVQADLSDKLAKQGAGLGLSITKAYVNMLGGSIWLESKEGIGSSFFFVLPFTNNYFIKPNTKTKMNQEESKEEKKLKIMIVEDDDHSMMLLSIIFKNINEYILKANSGKMALELYQQHQDIDLILMDIGLPDTSGLEIVKQIRQANKNVVIIAQTAFGFSGDKELSFEAGCNDYISKPIKKEVLIALIQKYFK